MFWPKNCNFWLYNLQIYQFPAFAVESRYKAYIRNQTGRSNIFFLLKWNQNQKYERPNETRGNKPQTKINPNAQERYPVWTNLLRSLRRFHNVILQCQVLPRLACFQLSSSGKNNNTVSELAKSISTYHLNLQKHINICCCSF